MQDTHKIYIKNMVCHRCVLAVEAILKKTGVEFNSVALGEVEIPGHLPDKKLEALRQELELVGFELIEDRNIQIIEKIKSLTVSYIRDGENVAKVKNLSTYLSENLMMDYRFLSSLFSSIEQITIEKYLLNQKAEYIKELLIYNELSISQIAWKLNYSSPQHLSAQFRKVTGMTPGYFKKLKKHQRKGIDEV